MSKETKNDQTKCWVFGFIRFVEPIKIHKWKYDCFAMLDKDAHSLYFAQHF